MALGTVLLTGWVENAVSVQGWRWAWPRPGETLRSFWGHRAATHCLHPPPRNDARSLRWGAPRVERHC